MTKIIEFNDTYLDCSHIYAVRKFVFDRGYIKYGVRIYSEGWETDWLYSSEHERDSETEKLLSKLGWEL